jgi:hypothetical protein
MREERIIGSCEGEMRESEMLYNLVMHRESTMFPYALGSIVDAF